MSSWMHADRFAPRFVTAAVLAGAIIAGIVRAVSARAGQTSRRRPPASLPAKLSDAEFWKVTSDISEPGGYFPHRRQLHVE